MPDAAPEVGSAISRPSPVSGANASASASARLSLAATRVRRRQTYSTQGLATVASGSGSGSRGLSRAASIEIRALTDGPSPAFDTPVKGARKRASSSIPYSSASDARATGPSLQPRMLECARNMMQGKPRFRRRLFPVRRTPRPLKSRDIAVIEIARMLALLCFALLCFCSLFRLVLSRIPATAGGGCVSPEVYSIPSCARLVPAHTCRLYSVVP